MSSNDRRNTHPDRNADRERAARRRAMANHPSARARRAEPLGDAVQLRLLDGGHDHEWTLDRETRRIGRQGVEAARAILRKSSPPEPGSPDSLAS